MQSMECGSRSGGGRRRLKDRLAQLLRPAANSLLRSPCSSSSSTALTSTAAATTTTISTSSTSTTAANYTTTTASLLPRAEPFSATLERLRRPPPGGNKEAGRVSSSSRHGSCRRFSKNAVVGKGGVRTRWSNPYGFTSSGEEEEDDDTDDDCYGDDDTETFLSSRSLMSSAGDTSGFYNNTSTRKPKPPPPRRDDDKSHCRRSQRRRRRCRRPTACGGAGAVSREPTAGFRPLVMATKPAAAEQVRKGLAVVKRSRDPYGDFRESMVEMIVGRQVFGAAELERLLRSYLTLNAPRFHPVIFQAFSDIWVVLHGG